MLLDSELCQDTLKEMHDQYGGDHEGCYRIVCAVCEKVFYRRMPSAKYCSYRCTNDAYIAWRRKRNNDRRIKTCIVCNKTYNASRKDSIYCSKACKQKRYRNFVTDTG